MKKINKCYQYIDNNFKKEPGKLAIVTGATGSIGEWTCRYLLHLEIDVVLAIRNKAKGEETLKRLKEEYPERNIYIEIVNIEDPKSIDNFIESIKKYKHIDYFFNNAGIFYISRPEDEIETHFKVNCLGTIYLTKNLLEVMKEGTIILVSSASVYFSKELYPLNLNLKKGSMIGRYGKSKRAETIEFLNIKEKYESDKLHFNIVHPGATATSLFGKGWGKLAMKFIYPCVEVIFPHVSQASLSILSGIQRKTPFNHWIGPRGPFKLWGKPKEYKFKKNVYEKKTRKNVNLFIEKYNTLFIK